MTPRACRASPRSEHTAADHRECMTTLDRFMAALNAWDAAAMDREMHFPHVRLAQGRVSIYEKPGSNPMDLFERLAREDGWKYSRWGILARSSFGP